MKYTVAVITVSIERKKGVKFGVIYQIVQRNESKTSGNLIKKLVINNIQTLILEGEKTTTTSKSKKGSSHRLRPAAAQPDSRMSGWAEAHD